ncbi:MAG: amidohydrolase family protein, partial [Holophaga sp.]|nr:amidohydrolase family protein [Holophaga sp.]
MLATPPPPPPIVILAGADLWQDDGVQGKAQSGQALAIRGEKIAAIGPKANLIKRFPKAQVINLEGGTLLPGFVEGHCHVEGLGKLAFYTDLGSAKSLDEALKRVQTWCAANPDGWVQGRGWDQNLWRGQAFPAATDLDRVTGSRPAALVRVDGHAMWANSAALKAAGITAATADPKGGQILRDATGNPTGILLDMAMELVNEVLPPPTMEHREAWVKHGLLALRDLGFTAACDMGGDATTLAIYRRLAAAKALPIRVFSYFDNEPTVLLAELKRPRAKTLSFFQVQGVKFYFDGAHGSRGARMFKPYADA